jgi:hypothetical protein
MLFEDDARMRGTNEPRQLVPAVLYWSAAQIIALELDQVEGAVLSLIGSTPAL